ncbi:tripartite tricarboxylate transporter substrate binding protein [Rubrivivax gelatinosus]|uniref:Tripartite-type tricarboxylate transporter receptor subunit TctC n=1 Tax=Rubrivivax gelatinosus TaxID=28068 RepID=A0A4R2M9K2_RUBGE|nr:tripartite tricarboxylate transporter substrate binding protein [Rubrivivax gelatinosus]MBK1688814.1 MFS transporter [Rubrivivax gelatinosus]TCP02861.1 tripartite-type tricarboxylate transporter receptor subunit TctC [Rubrivivax gelatinosus]
MTRITRRTWIAAAALAGAGAALPALAQPAYPNKPIKLVVGYAAGGATDVIARLVGQKLGDSLGQTVVIDNRAGANSNVGAEAVARSPADGYTLYVYTIANTINATLYPKLGYDPEKDFEPIGLIAKVPNILVVNKDVPVKTLAEYVAYTKAQPQGVSFASSGSGSSIHLSGEMFKMMTKLNMLHVPYRGSAPAVSDLLGGQVQSMFDNAPSAMPHIQSGRLRPIAITSPQRSPLLPDVPTFIESGYADFDVQSWFGLAAPAGTPAAIVSKLNAELAKVLALPEVKKRLAEMGATPAGGSPADMRKFASAEIKRWNAVVKASGAKAD